MTRGNSEYIHNSTSILLLRFNLFSCFGNVVSCQRHRTIFGRVHTCYKVRFIQQESWELQVCFMHDLPWVWLLCWTALSELPPFCMSASYCRSERYELYHLFCLNWHVCVCIHVCTWNGNMLEGEVMQFVFNQYRGQGEGRREKDVLIPKGEYTSSTELSVSSLRSTDEKCSNSAFNLILPLVKPPHWQGWGRKVMLPVQHDLFPLL